ncbi:hypothetical protein [Imperialibacter roseus]|uniref:LVIVD repeat-containing protein n=1 Tax=Imperialibacter roseus TaxID=1324217 RepID=A0ABZ0IZ58_9BACT|nr:hypothetical protein [Imperialibacter roseus]WOK09669.1 hypothetical protein RT717_13580 [Imperialibacter roseus]|tara:strand:- start:6729 stop:8072 length:1344 start_codon:yes stop_codon:yes gene_type:complete
MNAEFHPHEVKDIFRITVVSIVILIVIGFLSTGCTDTCEVDRSYTYFKPVYTTTEEIRSAVAFGTPQSVNQPGKIYFKDGILFINEVGEGIHIIDNTNPSSPRQLSFVTIPGNFDMAAKGNYLYADSYIDLLVFDISNVNDVKMVKRVEGAFQEFANLPFNFDAWSGVVTSYEEASVAEVSEIDCQTGGGGLIYYAVDAESAVGFASGTKFVANTSGAAPATTSADAGVGGSMARFAIYEDFLYTIDASSLYLFDITQLDDPQSGARVDIGWGIETLFPYEDKLFIGANNGMHIYDNANPEAPEHLSTYQHIQSCDPVVVEGDYAYVTLRSGNACQGFTNQLEIVDISDLKNPKSFQTYPMQNPHGLGVDGKCLFICEGEFGLKLFDKTDLTAIDDHLVANYTNMHAFDVIPLNGVLMMIGEDGLYQYEYDCEGKLELLSTIPVLAL